MKLILPHVLAIGLAAFNLGSFNLAQAADNNHCDDVAREVKRRVESDASQVLIVVEDLMIKNEKCACEVIKTAITTSSADALLVKQIVFTAVAAAPGMASSISECAMAVKPDASKEIAEGLQSALGMNIADNNTGDRSGKAGYDLSGKAGYDFSKDAKIPLPVVPSNPPDDFGYAPVDIRGVYLIQPVSAGRFISREEDCDCDSIACKEVKQLGKLLRTTSQLDLDGKGFSDVRDALKVINLNKVTNEDVLKLRNSLKDLEVKDLKGNVTLIKLRDLLKRFDDKDLSNSAWKTYLDCFKEGNNPVSPSMASTAGQHHSIHQHD